MSIAQYNEIVLPRMLKRLLKFVLSLFLAVNLVLLAGAFWLNHQIFSPPRRMVQDYQLKYLNEPEQFGLKIRHYACLDGAAPCLLVEPDATKNISERAQLIRDHILQRRLALSPYGKVQATLVLLHGRNSRKESLLSIAERFVALGFRCLLIDLPSHGDSPKSVMSFGATYFESSLPRRALLDIRTHFNLPDEPSFLWGMSMGGAFAVAAAQEDLHFWQGMVVLSSFADLASVMQRQVPKSWRDEALWLYPLLNLAQWLQGEPTINQIQPQDWAKQVKIPALLLHGTQDRFVSFEQGQQLYQALASPDKRWVSVTGAGHNNVLSTAQPVYADMGAWLLQHLNKP